MIDINFNELSVDELLVIYANLDEYIKFLDSEVEAAKKVINANEWKNNWKN